MIKLWIVFTLEDAVDGISNDEIQYDEYSYTLGIFYKGVFKSESDCLTYIEKTMKDYNSRGVDKNTRLTILPIYCSKDDEIFKLTK